MIDFSLFEKSNQINDYKKINKIIQTIGKLE